MNRHLLLVPVLLGLLATPSAIHAAEAAESPPEPAPREAAAERPGAAVDGKASGEQDRGSSLGRSLRLVGRDYRALVRRPRLVRTLGGLAVGGLIANTDADQGLYDDYRDWSGEQDLADLSSVGKAMGEAEVVLPLFILPGLVLGLDEPADAAPLGRWWRRTARAYLVGAPPLYYLQQITGGERPGDPGGSDWQPFDGNHGISGHAFLGAVPFLTLARQAESPWLKGAAVAVSLLPAWSRVEDGDHFPSQAALGWLLAWEATGAVARTGEDRRRVAVTPLLAPGGGGLSVRLRMP